MYVPSNARKYVCADCRNKITTEDLEMIFRSQIKGYPLPADAPEAGSKLYDDWPKLPFKFKREFVETVTKRIEVAEYLGLATSTLNKWRCHGGGPVFVKLGRAVRYRREDLDAFVVSRSLKSTSEKL